MAITMMGKRFWYTVDKFSSVTGETCAGIRKFDGRWEAFHWAEFWIKDAPPGCVAKVIEHCEEVKGHDASRIMIELEAPNLPEWVKK